MWRGFNAQTTLDLDSPTQGELRGSFTFTLVGDHEPGKERRGELRGKLGADGAVSMETELPDVGRVAFEGRLFDVRYHARQAMAGVYTLSGAQQRPARGGTAIFWLYVNKR
jgi:hypothetical protein